MVIYINLGIDIWSFLVYNGTHTVGIRLLYLSVTYVTQ